jgi:hypothetical protein
MNFVVKFFVCCGVSCLPEGLRCRDPNFKNPQSDPVHTNHLFSVALPARFVQSPNRSIGKQWSRQREKSELLRSFPRLWKSGVDTSHLKSHNDSAQQILCKSRTPEEPLQTRRSRNGRGGGVDDGNRTKIPSWMIYRWKRGRGRNYDRFY